MNNAQTKETEATPDSTWANWALLQAYYTKQSQGTPVPDSARPQLMELIVDRFAATVNEGDYGKQGPRCYVVYLDCGYWGRGKTIAEAVQASKPYSRTAKVKAVLVLNDGTAEVGGDGRVIADSGATILDLGWVGTVGSVLNAQPK